MIRQLENTQVENIITDLRQGASVTAAARNAGTSKARLGNIVTTARRAELRVAEGECTPDELDPIELWAIEFYIAMEKAQGQLEQTLLDLIVEAAKKDWKAAAWTLERLFPDRFAKRPIEPKAPTTTNSLTIVSIGGDPQEEMEAEARKIIEASGMDIAKMSELAAGRPAPKIDVLAEIGDLRNSVPAATQEAVDATVVEQEAESAALYDDDSDF